MKTKNKFGWFVIISTSFTVLVILVLAALFWHQVSPPEKQVLRTIFTQYFIYLFAAGFLLFAGLGFMIDWVFRIYIIPISKLSEEVGLIYSANPSHRIDTEGSIDFMRLVEQINAGAEQHEALEKSVSRRISIANAELEEEKNILAAIMAELPDAVLICNQDGRIILYNTQAKRYFSEQKSSGFSVSKNGVNGDGIAVYEKKRFLGIGRSIFGLIDKNIIQHALDEMHARLDRNEENVVSNFVLTAKGNRLLRAETVPILTAHRRFSGFIIIFNDITQGLRTEARAEFLMRSFQDKIRHSVASIISAIEVIMEYPQMESSQHHRLTEIIRSESTALGHLIQQESGETFRPNKTQWPLVPVSAAEIIDTFRKKAGEILGIELKMENSSGPGRIKVDTYTMVLILLFLLEHIIKDTDVQEFSCSFSTMEKFVHIDITWQGRAIKIEKLREWEAAELQIEREGLPLYLKEVLEYHEAEVWSYADREIENRSCLRIYLPLHRTYETDTARNVAVLPENRPEFYNFDLFNQPGQNPDLDLCMLGDLTYTIFDTETTGLDPGSGDRIISIGAVRIVKLHMLKEESFNQMVNPERDIPAQSTKIHGINAKMVQFKPGIEKVLPLFSQFVEDTILVAHNAAFDMRMLQTCEAKTKIKFINPVLDTLLLSAVIHPAHTDHNLSDIAKRLGVTVLERHTARGDAMTTAEIFLKQIPLLANMGIHTLKEARKASEKTYYARLKY